MRPVGEAGQLQGIKCFGSPFREKHPAVEALSSTAWCAARKNSS